VDFPKLFIRKFSMIITLQTPDIADYCVGQAAASSEYLLYTSHIIEPFTNKKIASNCYQSLATWGMLAEGQNEVKGGFPSSHI